MEHYFITASLVLYNNSDDDIRNLANSILSSNIQIKLIIVDNSPISLQSHIRSYLSNFDYTHNPENPGFGASHNYAIAEARKYESIYHIVINPDIFFDPEEIKKMFDFMENNPEVGQLMPKILYPDGTMQFLCKRNPTIFDLFARRFFPEFLKRIFQHRLDSFEYRDQDLQSILYDVPYFSGCFMFFRFSALEVVGLFDDRIFMYIEDADITRRMLENYRTVYFPRACVYHHFQKGSHKNRKLLWYSIEGAYIYFQKWGWKLI